LRDSLGWAELRELGELGLIDLPLMILQKMQDAILLAIERCPSCVAIDCRESQLERGC
jgi:hypothetical protein